MLDSLLVVIFLTSFYLKEVSSNSSRGSGFTLASCHPLSSCLMPSQTSAGCDNDICESRVCKLDSGCCEDLWDEGCVEKASIYCCHNSESEISAFAQDVAIKGLCDKSSNCHTKPRESGGCNNSGCENEVCTLDSWCCDNEWDEQCVQEANIICCNKGLCTPSNCFEENDGRGCENKLCQAKVCLLDLYCCDEQWDATCADTAKEACCSSDTNAPSPTGTESPTMPILGTEEPTTPFCDASSDCFISPKNSPGCNNPLCEELVCSVDSFCCDAGSTWDDQCVAIAIDQCCFGTTFIPTTSPSDTTSVPTTSPSLSPTIITLKPTVYCSPVEDCFVSNRTKGCGDDNCESTVCSLDPWCCDTSWDNTCVEKAQKYCCNPLPSASPTLSSLPTSSPTDVPSPNPTPSPPTMSPTLPTSQPSIYCVKSDDCFIANRTKGCNDETCESMICDIDPWCCEMSWDIKCVETAHKYCCNPLPSSAPTLSSSPSVSPSTLPSAIPSAFPSSAPSLIPTSDPTSLPTFVPSLSPTKIPSAEPSDAPSKQPSTKPSSDPSAEPSNTPSDAPSKHPSTNPSSDPSAEPSNTPSHTPSKSKQPSTKPSSGPSAEPSKSAAPSE